MNKGLLFALVAAAAFVVVDASARCCNRARSCRRSCEVVSEPVVSYVSAPAFVAEVEPAAPICKIPCVTYKNVPAIRHVSYSCPPACLTEAQLEGHMANIRTTHDDAGIQVEILG